MSQPLTLVEVRTAFNLCVAVVVRFLLVVWQVPERLRQVPKPAGARSNRQGLSGCLVTELKIRA